MVFGKENLGWCGYSTVKSLMIRLAVLTEYQHVTDRRMDKRTDERTDILRRHSPRIARR